MKINSIIYPHGKCINNQNNKSNQFENISELQQNVNYNWFLFPRWACEWSNVTYQYIAHFLIGKKATKPLEDDSTTYKKLDMPIVIAHFLQDIIKTLTTSIFLDGMKDLFVWLQ